jgi:hypothetical protein
MNEIGNGKFIVASDKLPKLFPTHTHSSEFWEALGRAVGTFGFLEEMLGKSIFALTATRPYKEEEIETAFKNWIPKLEQALWDQLGGLIDSFGKAVREHPNSNKEDLNKLLLELKKASKIRNVLCHGAWRNPDCSGASLPFFVNRKMEVFETMIDYEFLNRLQKQIASLSCEVINMITQMGFQFPGSSGPGVKIWT